MRSEPPHSFTKQMAYTKAKFVLRAPHFIVSASLYCLGFTPPEGLGQGCAHLCPRRASISSLQRDAHRVTYTTFETSQL